MHQNATVVAVLLLLVVAGCAGPGTSQTTTPENETHSNTTVPTPTTATTQTLTPTTTTTTTARQTSENEASSGETGSQFSVQVAEQVDKDGYGYASAFTLAVTADTTLENSDVGDPGEPYLIVKIDGQEIKRTEVERAADYTGTISVSAEQLGTRDRAAFLVGSAAAVEFLLTVTS